MAVMDFLSKYFITPIYTDSGYNIFNTIVYAIIALVALIGIYKLLRKLNIKVNNKFFYAVLPFIIFGSSLRSFVDAGNYNVGFWTVSPGIYILTAFIFLATLGICIWLEKLKKIAYWKTCACIGTSIFLVSLALVASKLQIENLKYGFAIMGIAAAISLALWYAFRLMKFHSGTKHFIVFPAHMLDAAATFIAVDFLAASEKHPLPAFMSDIAGTAAIMFALKLIVLIPLVYFMNKEFGKDEEGEQFATFMLIAIAVLGFAEGIRDLLTIILV